jgi:mRNA interferase MazF
VATAVKARIVRIGNSQGIRIPKVVIEQAGLKDAVELEARKGQLLVRPPSRPRDGWEDQFRAMAERGEDAPIWMRAHRSRRGTSADGSGDPTPRHLSRGARPVVGSEIRKTRPCLVISPVEMNRHLRTVIVAPMTTKGRLYPTRVPCRFQGKEAMVVLDRMHAIARDQKKMDSVRELAWKV